MAKIPELPEQGESLTVPHEEIAERIKKIVSRLPQADQKFLREQIASNAKLITEALQPSPESSAEGTAKKEKLRQIFSAQPANAAKQLIGKAKIVRIDGSERIEAILEVLEQYQASEHKQKGNPYKWLTQPIGNTEAGQEIRFQPGDATVKNLHGTALALLISTGTDSQGNADGSCLTVNTIKLADGTVLDKKGQIAAALKLWDLYHQVQKSNNLGINLADNQNGQLFIELIETK